MAIAIVHTESVQSMLSPLCTDVLGWVERAGLGAYAKTSICVDHVAQATAALLSWTPARRLPRFVCVRFARCTATGLGFWRANNLQQTSWCTRN